MKQNLTKQEIFELYGLVLGLLRANNNQLLEMEERFHYRLPNYAFHHFRQFGDWPSITKARKIYLEENEKRLRSYGAKGVIKHEKA
jgi:hypothetical protein